MTKTETIVALLAELVETHMLRSAGEGPAVASDVHGTAADIEVIRTSQRGIAIELDDGSGFSIIVERY